jgi:tryptophan synthase alpha subunit
MSALLKFALLGFEIALCHKKKEKLFVDFITACKPNYQQSITQSHNMLG